MENEWNSIKDTIMAIKKKREETRRKRGIDVESMLTEELSKNLAQDIDKSILAELMKNMK